jgi:hypothetical protein
MSITRLTIRFIGVLCFAWLIGGLVVSAGETTVRPLRAGIIGLDTSHVRAFTPLFNEAKPDSELAGIKIVAAYPGGTDVPMSRDRVGMFTDLLRGMGVEIVDTIPALLAKVDVVLLESVDGRIHLSEATQVIKAGKPVFIDKPVGGSLADAIAIYELARKHDVPCFSCSSSRVSASINKLRTNPEVGEIMGAATWGPCSYQEGIPDMFFYGIHGIEALFTLMGPGCETVGRVQTRDADHLTGVWKGGRIGTYRGLRGKGSGAIAFGSVGVVQSEKGGSASTGYEALCRAIAGFFKTGKMPVTPEETIELFTFMEAADESKRLGGAPVALAPLLAKARAEAKTRLPQE